MASQELDISREFFGQWESLSLTEEELSLPVWGQIFDNRVIERECVKVLGDTEIQESDDLSKYNFENDFSDEETDSVEKKENDEKKVTSFLRLRDYQHELAEKALQGLNTVICAPTGSGKTRVATHIILEHLKNSGIKRKKVAFLATTVPLTVQQYKALLKYLPMEYKITSLTGQDKNSMSLESLFDYNDIFVMTPMILVNNIQRCNLKLDMFSLMIFDECHHTRKFEPYNLLMSTYLKNKSSGLQMPQIVGLTATIGIEESTSVDEAQNVILDFLGNLDTPHLVTVKKFIAELNKLVPKPKEEYLCLQELQPDEIFYKIIEIINKLEEKVKEFVLELNDEPAKKLLKDIPPNKKIQAYGQWAVKLTEAVYKVPNENLVNEKHKYLLLSAVILEYLQKYNAALEMYDLVEPLDILKYLENNFRMLLRKVNKTSDEIQFYDYFEGLKQMILSRGRIDNDNLNKLAEVVMRHLVRNENADQSRGIIFVKTRALADSIKSWLNRSENTDLKNLNAEVFTGANVSEELGGTSQNRQDEIKERFKEGTIKVLVATSVAEEGLDIPNCNLIIKYNHVGNEVTSVQTKGRSRQFGGLSVLLAMQEVVIREIKNKEKTVIMEVAIKLVSNMNNVDVILKYQQKKLDSLKINKPEKLILQTDKYRVVCRKCRQVGIESFNMRTIYGKYRVSIDRELLSNKFVVCTPHEPEFMDELEFIGPVFCRGQLSPGKYCGYKLGQMIKHKKIPFFNVGIKFIGIVTDDSKPLILCKQWKKMPYHIEELSFDEIMAYIQ
ncbi:Antiviral innate immune response receptor RIG-I [Bulinus truncatus]|nr:Antiviral innate immune response receptor RIG-I [Bulinus truncatus]